MEKKSGLKTGEYFIVILQLPRCIYAANGINDKVNDHYDSRCFQLLVQSKERIQRNSKSAHQERRGSRNQSNERGTTNKEVLCCGVISNPWPITGVPPRRAALKVHEGCLGCFMNPNLTRRQEYRRLHYLAFWK